MARNLEQQFEEFFNDCKKEGFTKTQMLNICQPIIILRQRNQVKRLIVLIGIIALFYLIINNFNSVSWILSAIGRLMLIKLLPIWNWIPLYNSKCLVWRDNNVDNSISDSTTYGRYETNSENCILCEDIGSIPTALNVTFSLLETNYLESGLPVIVTDSHNLTNLTTLLDRVLTQSPDFLDSEPCDLATNLMLKKLFNLEVAFEKIHHDNGTLKWFLQLRNCQFRAVKASRILMPRSYFYPLHLEPFYTSWLLMSHNYALELRRLFLQGLIFVQQLSGNFNIKLEPKIPCNEYCPVINIHLKAGESLIFSTDLWIFYYSLSNVDFSDTSIATILEFNWNL